MGVGEILHVDVVAHARPVAGGVVVAHDGHGTAALHGRQEVGHEVRLRPVVLAVRGGRPGHVEVAQRDRAQAVGRAVPGQGTLEGQLRGAVRVERPQRRVLGHGDRLGQAVDRRGRAEDQAAQARLAHGLQEGDAAHDVLVVVEGRVAHRLADLGARRAVEDRVDPADQQEGHDRRRVADAADDQLGLRRDGQGVAGDQRVEHGDLVARLQQPFHGDAADVARPAGDEDVHQRSRKRRKRPRRRPGGGAGPPAGSVAAAWEVG